MSEETMSPKERVEAALRLEKPDRVPVAPLVSEAAAANLMGYHNLANVYNDMALASDLSFQVFDKYGGWDSFFGGGLSAAAFQVVGVNPMKQRVPGIDLPEDEIVQAVEEDVLKYEDYEKICEMGFNNFYYEDYLFRICDIKREEVAGVMNDLKVTADKVGRQCSERGIEPLVSDMGSHPFFALSMMRSLVEFTKDLYFKPDMVEKTMKRMTADLISEKLPAAKKSGLKRWQLGEERASNYYYPLSIFERFWWPYLEEIVDAFWSEGIVTFIHMDTCWDKNLPYFKKLPRGSVALELDSATDIFLAKEILGGHQTLCGDVSGILLSVSKPEDVEAYCKKLIDEVGGDGGFILSSGCCVPPNVKPENFRIMLETGRNYEFSKTG